MRINESGIADSYVTEIPTELDASLHILNIQAQFPETTGLRYRSETNTWRAVRRLDNTFFAPHGGWGDKIYAVVKPIAGKICLIKPQSIW